MTLSYSTTLSTSSNNSLLTPTTTTTTTSTSTGNNRMNISVVNITEDNFMSIYLQNMVQFGYHSLPMPCHVLLRFIQCALTWNNTFESLQLIDPTYHQYRIILLNLFPIHFRLSIDMMIVKLPSLLCISKTNCNLDALLKVQSELATYAHSNWYQYLTKHVFATIKYTMYYSIQQHLIQQHITYSSAQYLSFTRELLTLSNIPLMQMVTSKSSPQDHKLLKIAVILTGSSLVGKILPGQADIAEDNITAIRTFRRDYYRPGQQFLQSFAYELEDLLPIADVEIVYGYGYVDEEGNLMTENCHYVRDFLQQHPFITSKREGNIVLPVHCLMSNLGKAWHDYEDDQFHVDVRITHLQFVQQQLFREKEKESNDGDYYVICLDVVPALDIYFTENVLDRSEETKPTDFTVPEELAQAEQHDVFSDLHWTKVLRKFHSSSQMTSHVQFRSGWLLALIVPLLHSRLSFQVANSTPSSAHVGISFHICPRPLSFKHFNVSMQSQRLMNFAIHQTTLDVLQRIDPFYGLQWRASKQSNDYLWYNMYDVLHAVHCLDGDVIQEPHLAGGQAMLQFYEDLNPPQLRHVITEEQDDHATELTMKFISTFLQNASSSNHQQYLQYLVEVSTLWKQHNPSLPAQDLLWEICDDLRRDMKKDPLLLASSYPSSIGKNRRLAAASSKTGVRKGKGRSSKVAVITAVYGEVDYEKTLKPFAYQSVATDFIAFTDNAKFQHLPVTARSHGWNVDLTPYHLASLEEDFLHNQSHLLNSLRHNQHPFNIAKFYKASFHKIPTLQDYDVVVWIDGTIAITNHTMTEQILQLMEEKDEDILVFEHIRKGKMKNEVDISAYLVKYLRTSWLGVSQPVQNITHQFTEYERLGYRDDYWQTKQVHRPHYGLWCTCLVAFRMWKYFPQENGSVKRVLNQRVRSFLDLWYLQIKTYSTQDQVSFSYALQKSGLFPYSLPDENIYGNMDFNSWYLKLDHGM